MNARGSQKTSVTPPVSRPGKRGVGLRREEALTGLLFVLPALLLFFIFGLYPFVRTITLSLTSWDGISAQAPFVGLKNYLSILDDPVWWLAVRNGLFFAVTALIFMNGLALALAVVVNQLRRGQQVYQFLFYMPTILSGIVVAIMWKWLYQPIGGPLNRMLESVGLQGQAWLSDPQASPWAVAIASMWAGLGNPFLLFLAGLQSIPKDVLEAARVDGATEWKAFRWVTFPLMIPVIMLVSILTILGAMQIFNLVVAMTGGGPGYATEVPVLRIYREAFKSQHFGYATALSMVFGLMLLLLSLVQMKLSRRFDYR